MILGQQLILTSYPFGEVSFHVYLNYSTSCIGRRRSSVDVEHSFSIYKTILADNSQSLKMANIKMLAYIHLEAQGSKW